ncbi:MAG: hypothetical protein PVS3B2_07550 [Candidatus Dormibacteraceae bacterium]
MGGHKRLSVAKPYCGPAQILKDRFTQEWDIAGAVHVTDLSHSILLVVNCAPEEFAMRMLEKQTA